MLVSADDVSASHGGTVGELDEAAIFYMQTRGLDRPAAVRVIVEGFFEPLIARARRRAAGRARAREDRRQARGGARGHRGVRHADESTQPYCATQLDVHEATTHSPDRAGRARPTSRSSRGEFDGAPLIYLDSGATSQKPEVVIEAVGDYYLREHNANVHRGVYALAQEADAAYDGARKRVAAFVGWRAARRRSSPRTSPRRSTSSPTPGAARTSAPATRC